MKDLLVSIFGIFKGVGRVVTFLRILTFNLLFLGVVILIAVSLLRTTKEPVTEPNSILVLKLSGDIVEQRRQTHPIDDSLGELFGLAAKTDETVLQEVIDCIDQAAVDSRINAILLDLASLGRAGGNQLAAIGEALDRFRKSGKQIVAAEDFYNQSQYYLAAHADRIYLNPMGLVRLGGYGVFRLYFKDALENLKINYHVFRVGEFKSALEPFTRNSMSAEDRLQSRAWLSDLWEAYLKQVSEHRSVDAEAIERYINDIPANLEAAGGDMAQLALDSGLVDRLAHRTEIVEYLASLSAPSPTGGFRSISSSRYLKQIERSHSYQGNDQETVAIIVIQGAIMPGESGPAIVGADTVSRLLRSAGRTPNVKAVVLRIDSGGGSAFASEVIRQEILELKKKGKPVLVSMGTMAASGAYWLSADADEIWAAPETLTGSIGIFMALPTFENLLDHAGVYRDGVGTTNLSGALDLAAPLTPEVRQAIQLSLENGYRTFLEVVAEGRNLPVEQVETIAQGKVFSGSAAREAGLVDRLGSLDQTIAAAAAAAGIDQYRTSILRPRSSLTSFFLQRLSASLTGTWLTEAPLLGPLLQLLLKEPPLPLELQVRDPNGIFAYTAISYHP